MWVLGGCACMPGCVLQLAVHKYCPSPPSKPLPPPPTDADNIDASIGGIIKRVVVLLLALSALGTALFYLGLKFTFPESPY